MASSAQSKANRENAQHSTGPRTEAGKQASSRNNSRHGLTGQAFVLLDWEDGDAFDILKKAFVNEHKPATPTEHILVEKMAQAHWLAQRAQQLQSLRIDPVLDTAESQKSLAQYIRYQAHHERVFRSALTDLLKLRAERRKEQIGFESQKSREAQETRRAAAENRTVEQHQTTMAILESRLKREKNKAMQAEIDTADKMYKSLGPEAAEMIAANTQKRAA